MNCNHCQAEWTAPNSNNTHCPFCGKSLIITSGLKLGELLPQDILKNIYNQYGDEVFTDSIKLSGILADLLQDKKILKMYRLAVQEKIPNELLKSKHLDTSIRKNIKIRTLKLSFREANFLEAKIAHYIIDSFAYALGWINEVSLQHR